MPIALHVTFKAFALKENIIENNKKKTQKSCNVQRWHNAYE